MPCRRDFCSSLIMNFNHQRSVIFALLSLYYTLLLLYHALLPLYFIIVDLIAVICYSLHVIVPPPFRLRIYILYLFFVFSSYIVNSVTYLQIKKKKSILFPELSRFQNNFRFCSTRLPLSQ